MREKPFAAAPERNQGAILGVLQDEFRGCTSVLEVGSGTGQHAVAFARHLRHLQWQSSDLDENLAGIRAWLDESGFENLPPPIALDVRSTPVDRDSFDAVFSANTAHIMSEPGVRQMFALVGRVLRKNGVFGLYGPFRQNRCFDTESNAAFDRSLRFRDPSMGVRDMEDLDDFASEAGMRRLRSYAMPSNNRLLFWINDEASGET